MSKEALKCDGSCDQHSDDVVKVNVTGWGQFNYCSEAIMEDRRRGLFVTIIEAAHNIKENT